MPVTLIPSVSYPNNEIPPTTSDVLTLVNGTDVVLLMTGSQLLLLN